MNDTPLNCGMSAPRALPLPPRIGSRLLYTLTATNARIAMTESTFGRHLREGDVQPLIITHESEAHGAGEVVTITGVVLTSRGVTLPVDGVPLVREPSPGAAHWPMPDESLAACLAEEARNDVPLKQPSGQTGMPAPLSPPSALGLLRQVRDALVSYLEPGGLSAPVAMEKILGIVDNAGAAALINGPDGISPQEAQVRDDLVTASNNEQYYKLRAELVQKLGAAEGARDVALRERDEARAALAALQGVGAEADRLRDECSHLANRLNRAMNMTNSARESLGSVGV